MAGKGARCTKMREKEIETYEVGVMAGEKYLVVFVDADEVDEDCDNVQFSVGDKKTAVFKNYLYYRPLTGAEKFGEKFEALAQFTPSPE